MGEKGESRDGERIRGGCSGASELLRIAKEKARFVLKLISHKYSNQGQN